MDLFYNDICFSGHFREDNKVFESALKRLQFEVARFE